jgi:hypothetical protein
VDARLITFLVTDQQDLFFRRGLADAGEDTTRWFLFEWRDLPTYSQLEPGSFGSIEAPTPVNRMTWGGLKARYGPASVRQSTWGWVKALFRSTASAPAIPASAGGSR